MKKKLNPLVRMIILGVFISLLLGSFQLSTSLNRGRIANLGYKELSAAIKKEQVKSMNVQPKNGIYTITGEFNKAPEKDEKKQSKFFHSTILENNTSEITKLAYEHNVKVIVLQEPHSTALGGFISSLFMFILFISVMSFMLKKMTSGKNSPLSMGQHKASINIKSTKKFENVIGYEEEKQELMEIVDYLKNPQIYHEMGAKVPNGVLLEGPPGTGKTLMAKAIAGEAGVNFFSMSGSDFVEMYVGVGASRVRDLFKQAKKNAPAIIFIDEIDAIGSRDSNGPGRNSEQEQTINTLLVELDGFATNHDEAQVIIIGATNRADKLDPALLRVGRFDRKIMMGLPELQAREDILRYHAKTRVFVKDVNFNAIARATTGLAGSELEGIINESAILAVRQHTKEISQDDLEEAIDRVLMGPAKIKNKYSKKDKKMVSYHESGHAIIGLELEDANVVQKITIIPRGRAGGYVSYAEKEEQRFITKKSLIASIISAMGGRAAEELFIGDITTGAQNDFMQATRIARAMVTEFGMTDLGFVQLEDENSKNPYANKKYSEKTAQLIDDRVTNVLNDCYEEAKKILLKRKADVDLLASCVQKQEVISKEEIDYLIKHRELPPKKEVDKYTQEEIDLIKLKNNSSETIQEVDNQEKESLNSDNNI